MRPLEPINLDDPAGGKQPQRENVHPTPPTKAAAAESPPAKIHPTPAPLTFADIFGAVFLAILAAAAVIWIIAWIANVRQEHEKQQKELEELHQRARP